MDARASPWDPGRVERRLLALQNRRRIVEHVHAHPGIHLRQLARDLGLAIGTTEHHLHLLAQHGVLEAQHVRNRTSYFARGMADPELRQMLGLLRSAPQRRLLRALAEDPDLDAAGLAERLGLPAGTVSYHVQRLMRLGVLEDLRVGRSRLLRVRRPEVLEVALAARQADRLPGTARAAAAPRPVRRAAGVVAHPA